MALPKIVADFETSLTAKIAIGGTTGTIASNVDDDGVTLADGTYYFTLDGNNSAKEHIKCTKTGTSLSSIYSVSRQGVETSGTAREHRVGAKVIMTDYATYKNYFEAAVLTGPGSSTDNAVIRWNGTAGNSLQNSGVIVDDSDNVYVPGAINLGHASDTTISRVSAGVVAVEGVTVPTISSTNTLTNKRITERVITTTDDSTAVIDVDTTDVYELSAVANATTFSTTGTPTDGQKLFIRFKDAGVAKGITWDAVFVAIGVTLPTTTVVSKWHYIGCQYNSAASKWHVLAVSQEV